MFAEKSGKKTKSGGAIGMPASIRTARNHSENHKRSSVPKILFNLEKSEDSIENLSVINSSSASIEEAIHSTPSTNSSTNGTTNSITNGNTNDNINGNTDDTTNTTTNSTTNGSLNSTTSGYMDSFINRPDSSFVGVDSGDFFIGEISSAKPIHVIDETSIGETTTDEKPTRVSPAGDHFIGEKSSFIYSQVEPNANSKQLIRYLSKVNGSAYTLNGLVRQLGFSNISPDLLQRLEGYVVSPTSQIESPNEMPMQHLVLANTEPGPHKRYSTVYDDNGEASTAVNRDDEAFLMRVWSLKHKRIEPSEFNAELHNGPWMELVNETSRKLVIYILLHCDVFKYIGETGSWLCLGRSFDLSPYYKFQYVSSKRSFPQSKWQLIDKHDIMYRHKGRNEHEFFASNINELLNQPLCNELRQHIACVNHRLKRYTKLVLTDRARSPKYEYRKPNRYADVARFVSNVVKRLLPRGLIGSQQNFANFERQLVEFLPLRGKVEIKPLLKGIKSSEIPWLREINGDENSSRVQLQFCMLFMYNLVKHILQLHFYVTEMSGEPSSQVFYYVQDMWNRRMEGPATREFLKSNCAAANASSFQKNVVNWRFVPKKDGSLRPIINLKPLNAQLEVPHLILNYHVDNTMTSESSVRVKSWHAWMLKLTEFRNKELDINPDQKFYLVKADIASCYDSANRTPVKDIVRRTVDDGNTSYFVNNKAKLDVRKQRVRVGRDTRPLEPELYPMIPDHDRRLRLEFERPPFTIHHGTEVLEAVESIFDGIYLRVGKNSSVKFTAGIPQGSACSLDLCNMMLDDLIERKLSKYTASNHSILVRYVDDFLFTTTDKELACDFANDMTEGFSEYGVKSKSEKIVNTALDNDDSEKPGDNKVIFLGTGIEMPSLKLVPLPIEKANPDYTARGDKTVVQRRLSSDMDRLVSILRTFRRSKCVETPQYLEARVAKNIGNALAFRLKAVMKVYEEKEPHNAFYQALKQYLLPYVANNNRAFVKRVAFETYLETLKKHTKKYKTSVNIY